MKEIVSQEEATIPIFGKNGGNGGKPGGGMSDGGGGRSCEGGVGEREHAAGGTFSCGRSLSPAPISSASEIFPVRTL